MATQTRSNPRGYQQDYPNPDEWQEYAAAGADELRDAVRDNVGRSMLIALGAGLGVGFLIGASLASSDRSSRWLDRSAAEGIGRRLMDKLEGVVPEAVSDRLHR